MVSSKKEIDKLVEVNLIKVLNNVTWLNTAYT